MSSQNSWNSLAPVTVRRHNDANSRRGWKTGNWNQLPFPEWRSIAGVTLWGTGNKYVGSSPYLLLWPPRLPLVAPTIWHNGDLAGKAERYLQSPSSPIIKHGLEGFIWSWETIAWYSNTLDILEDYSRDLSVSFTQLGYHSKISSGPWSC